MFIRGICTSRIIALAVFLIFLFGCFTPERENSTTANNLTKLEIKSAFENFARIPKKYTCDGDNVIPSFEISGIPPNAKSIAVIVEDPDAPSGLFVHWIAWNLPPTGRYPEATDVSSLGGKEGVNSAGRYGYMGPCPPSGPAHRYFFKFYALDSSLNLSGAVSREHLLNAMNGHIIAEGEIVGKYGRN